MSKFKNQVSGLERNRRVNLKLGLLISLSVCWMAFNWEVQKMPGEYEPEYEIVDQWEIEEEIIRTDHPKPPPPAVLKPSVVFEPTPEPISLPDPEPILKLEPIEVPKKAKLKKVKPVFKPVVIPDTKDDDDDDDETIFVNVQEMPRFKSNACEDMNNKAEQKKCAETEMLKYLYKEIQYPNIARENGIEGIVVIQFVVDKTGKIVNPTIIKDIGAGCGKEALRVVEQMQDWIPGRQRTRNVNVQFNLPVRFKLQ